MTREMVMTATALDLPLQTVVRLPDLRDLAMYLMLKLPEHFDARKSRCMLGVSE
jgi:hypothetical protein